MTSSQRRRALEAMKLGAQETERQNAAAIQLEKERFQLKLEEIAEEKRSKLNEFQIDEYELADDSSEVDGGKRTVLGTNEEDGVTGGETANWVNSIVGQSEGDAAVSHRVDNVSQTSGDSEQVTNINLGDPNANTNITDDHNRSTPSTAIPHDTFVAETVDSMANTQANGVENAIIPPVQQDMRLHVEATTELQLSDHGLIGTQPSHSQGRSNNVYGQYPLVTNSYVPRMALLIVPARTSTSITTTNSAPNNTVGTNTNVVSTTTVTRRMSVVVSITGNRLSLHKHLSSRTRFN